MLRRAVFSKRGWVAASASLLTALVLSWSPAGAAATKCLPAELKSALAHIKRNYGDVAVISSFRKGASIIGTRKRSKHARCLAVDFNIRRNRKAAIQWLRKQKLEVITYGCSMHHVHIATGSYKGHHCVDKKGRRARR